MAYYKFSVATAALCNSGHVVEAAQRYLEAKKRWPVGSDATAWAFTMLSQEACDEDTRWPSRKVAERRGAQGAVGEGCEGGAGRY